MCLQLIRRLSLLTVDSFKIVYLILQIPFLLEQDLILVACARLARHGRRQELMQVSAHGSRRFQDQAFPIVKIQALNRLSEVKGLQIQALRQRVVASTGKWIQRARAVQLLEV